MKKAKQLSFQNYIKGSIPQRSPRECGGSTSPKGKRKQARTISTTSPMHLVLRSSNSSLLKKFAMVEAKIEKYAHRFGVKVYRKATCSNHIHFLIKVNARQDYIRFVRALTGALGKALKIKWEVLPYTRVISWGREFNFVRAYIVQNILEAFYAIPYQPRRRRTASRIDLTGYNQQTQHKCLNLHDSFSF